MSDTNFPLSMDDGHDDLPRTFRRAREEKEREDAAREASAANAQPPADEIHAASQAAPYATHDDTDGLPATVKRFDVPFFSLMMFFLKAVLAAIPALILLGALIWLGGEILQSFMPWLVKMQIFIHFPE